MADLSPPKTADWKTDAEDAKLTELYYSVPNISVYLGDASEVLDSLDPNSFAACITDPPYGDTSLEWDHRVAGWCGRIDRLVSASGSLWCFGSLRFFMEFNDFNGWKLAQDVVWEKHNGSSFHADRFKRVHEHIVQFYRGAWADVFKVPVTTPDATARTVRRQQLLHTGNIGASSYESEDGGPRLMRSVIYARSCHGHAIAPTQKPIAFLRPFVEYSSPIGSTVIDPFCGSGAVLVAAYTSFRASVGIDSDERQLEKTVKRLEHLVAGGVDACIAQQ